MSEIKKTTEYMDFESFFTTNLKDADPDLYDSLLSEFKSLKLCPSALLITLEENPYAVPHLKGLISG